MCLLYYILIQIVIYLYSCAFKGIIAGWQAMHERNPRYVEIANESDAEDKRIDALAKLKTIIFERPPHSNELVSELEQREAMIISILCIAGRPMLVEKIREAYIDKVFEYVAYTADFISKTHHLAMEIYKRNKLITLDKIEVPPKNPYADMLTPYAHLDTKGKATILSNFYHKYNPGIRKVPLLIGAVTVQDTLNNLAVFYKNLIETRPSSDGRAKELYYVNSRFLAEWRRQTAEADTEVSAKVTVSVAGADTQIFSGLRTMRLQAAIQLVDDMTLRLDDLLGNKSQQEVMDDLRNGIDRLGLNADSIMIPYEGYFPSFGKMLLPHGLDEADKLVEQILRNDPPKGEELEKMAAKS